MRKKIMTIILAILISYILIDQSMATAQDDVVEQITSCDACDSRFVNVTGDVIRKLKVREDLYVVNGNVGIGTIAPQSKLHLFNQGAVDLKISAFAPPYEPSVTFATDLDLWKIYRPCVANQLRFRNLYDDGGGIDDRLTITSSGNVGIGTTGPFFPLTVIRDLGVASGEHYLATFRRTDTSGASINLGYWADGSSHTGGFVRSTEALFLGVDNVPQALTIIQVTGNVGIGTTSPQEKLDVEGYVEAYGYYTGDIVFQKDGEKLWRMFEKEDGLYLENLKTGKPSKVFLEDDLIAIKGQIEELQKRIAQLEKQK